MPAQTQSETGVDVYYLPFGDDDDMERHAALTDLRFDIQFGDGFTLTQDEFEQLYEYQGHDPTATLSSIFPRWNAGSGQESAAFARRECQDCDAAFTGERDFNDRGERPSGARPENPVSLQTRNRRAEQHEQDTDHTVGLGQRSLSVGDIVVVDGTAHIVASFDFETLDHIEVDG